MFKDGSTHKQGQNSMMRWLKRETFEEYNILWNWNTYECNGSFTYDNFIKSLEIARGECVYIKNA
jgi:hypothetical protein